MRCVTGKSLSRIKRLPPANRIKGAVVVQPVMVQVRSMTTREGKTMRRLIRICRLRKKVRWTERSLRRRRKNQKEGGTINAGFVITISDSRKVPAIFFIGH